MSLPARVLGSLLLLAPAAGSARSWYVAPNGVDGASVPGTLQAPLATVAHAVTRSGSGDDILLQRGGTYFASNLQVGSGRSLGAWGTGADPVLTASTVVPMTGTWPTIPSVLTAQVPTQVLACFVDGRFVRLARWPNAPAFLRIDNDDSPDRIVDSELSQRPGVAAGRWTGAQVRWRRWSWWWETRPIANHSAADTLDLGPEGRFQDPFSDPGSGYFIDNDLDELDDPGEWFWGGGTLYVYPPAGANPATLIVEVVTAPETGLKMSGPSITGVAFKRFAGTALELNAPCTVDACTFEELETNAVGFTWNAQPFVVRNSVFRDVRNVAVSGWADAAGPAGSLVERNLFLRIGMEWGYGGSGSWHAAGIIVGNGHGLVVRLNRLVDIGYAGIIFGAAGQTAERNVIVRSMASLNDGGGVYTNCDASVIRENIILDTVGAMETSHPWWPLGQGIWPEFLEGFKDTQIVDNSVYGSNGNGIMLPNNFTATVTGNHVLDSRSAALGLSGDTTFGTNQDNAVSDNILAAVAPTRRVPRVENLNQWYLPPYTEPTPVALEYQAGFDYGLMSATTFIAPSTAAGVMRQENGSDLDTVGAWVAAQPGWASATASSVVRANAIMFFNDTEAAADMAVPAGTWTLPDGTAVGANVQVQPFRSVVLVSSAAVPNAPPYWAASGIDWRAAIPTTTILSPKPEIDVTRAGVPVPDGSTDTVSATAAGATKALRYTVANLGAAPLSLTVPIAPGAQTNCAVAIGTQPQASVASGASSSLQLTVTPTAAGAWSFSLSFATDDEDENPTGWTVSGTAAATPSPELDISRDARAIADGSTDAFAGSLAGVPASLTYVLANAGSGPLAVTTPISVSAPTGCAASVTTQPASTVVADATTSLVVSVTPSGAGAWSFLVSVGNDDTDESPYHWTVSGTATIPPDAGTAPSDAGPAAADASAVGDDAGASTGDASAGDEVRSSCGCSSAGALPGLACLPGLAAISSRRRRRASP